MPDIFTRDMHGGRSRKKVFELALLCVFCLFFVFNLSVCLFVEVNTCSNEEDQIACSNFCLR